MQGRIVKGIAGFYYVYVTDVGIIECKAKGAFRKDKIKPLVGDIAEIDILSEDDMTGNIINILPRRNELIRPAVANIDQALIIFALSKPEPNFVTLDKMILQYKYQQIPVILVFNKEDLVENSYVQEIVCDYSGSGCEIYITSASKGQGVDKVLEVLKGKLTIVAGPSGAGKSSLINCFLGSDVSETGDISDKLKRGKHTTRHSEIFPISHNTFIMDTPGFSSFDLFDIEKEELSYYYEEFDVDSTCRFVPCSHTHEPGCVIKNLMEEGQISKRRYDNYVQIYNELMQVRRY